MHILPVDDSLEPGQKKTEEEEQRPQEGQGGLDQRFNQRYLEKMQIMREAGQQMIDISITIHQKGDTVSLAREWKVRPQTQSSRVREGLKTKEGSLEFTTGGRDAPVEICVQSMAATPKTPSRVALSVSQQVKRKLQLQKPAADTPEKQLKMSRIERDLKKLEYKVDMLLTNADYAKEQEVDFHELSLAMNRASQYWPIIHLVVLLVTGFTQANHIIRFFKSRHIN
jgi:hypothetical protein